MTKRSMKKKTLDLTDGVGFEELNEYEEILQDFKTILITSSNVLELFPKITQEYTKQWYSYNLSRSTTLIVTSQNHF